MVPDKFNMVDMGDIDLIESQGLAVEGLYQRLVESIALCRYQCLYNWKFNGILIPPSYVEMELREGEVWINEGVSVDEEDVVHIYGVEPEPPAPVIPVIEPLQVTENGMYTAPAGVDGYSPVTVEVSSGGSVIELNREPTIQDGNVGDYCISTLPLDVDGFVIAITKAARGTNMGFTFWGTSSFRAVLEDQEASEKSITELENYLIWLSPVEITMNTSNCNALLTNPVSGSYIERSGLPGYICVTASDFSGYGLKSFSLCRRQGTFYIDYIVDFQVYWLKNNTIVSDSIYSRSDLSSDDWPDGQLIEFVVDSSIPTTKKLFYKTESGWTQII